MQPMRHDGSLYTGCVDLVLVVLIGQNFLLYRVFPVQVPLLLYAKYTIENLARYIRYSILSAQRQR